MDSRPWPVHHPVRNLVVAPSSDDDLTPKQALARDSLLADVRRVFPAKRPKPFPALVIASSLSDAVRAAEAFANASDWTVLDSEWLHSVPNVPNGLTEARHVLSPAAMCFYLPAYLVAALALELDPIFTLTYGFDVRTRDQPLSDARSNLESCTGQACARWAGLTVAQASVVVRFMEWRISMNDPCWDGDAVEALAFFWRARAGEAAVYGATNRPG